jgi:hypothetical protein
MSTGGTAFDSLGIRIEAGDRVMINSWGGNVRLTDVGRKGTVQVVGRVRPVITWDRAQDTPRGNVRPRNLAVLRRDGKDGFEGNRSREAS